MVVSLHAYQLPCALIFQHHMHVDKLEAQVRIVGLE
jgi:hypothetical protein